MAPNLFRKLGIYSRPHLSMPVRWPGAWSNLSTQCCLDTNSRFAIESPLSHFHCLLIVLLLMTIFGCDTKSPEKQFQDGLSALEEGDEEAVLAALNELRQHPEYADHVRLLVGISRQHAGDHVAALESFSRMTQDSSLSHHIQLHAGISYHSLGRLVEAETTFRTLVKGSPDSADAHRWLGIVYYDLGAYDFAIVHLSRLTELDPDDFRPYRLLGLMHRDFERDADSESFYLKALKRTPPKEIRREIVGELALAYISQRKYREALNLVESEPADAELLAIGSRCLMNLADKEKAASRLKEAARLDPDHRTVLMLQAEFFQADNHNTEAIGRLRRVVKLDHFDIEARYKLALLLQKIGSTDEYKAEIAEWEKQKKMKEQLTDLNIKALSEPFNSELRFELADLCEQLGKKELATMWRKAGESIRTAAP